MLLHPVFTHTPGPLGLPLQAFIFSIRRKPGNPIFDNILIALYKEIKLILKSEKKVFIIIRI